MLKASLKRRIGEKLQALVAEGAGPGFQLGLGFRADTLGIFTAGVQDFKNRRPVRSTTWYDLASLTKILASVDLLMRAYQEKKIPDLNLPLKTWFPFFSSELKNQTLLDVLNHRSGLTPIFSYTNELGEDLPSREDRIRFFLRKVDETYLPVPAEERRTVYSDVGYMLIGILLEQVFGKRLRVLFSGRSFLSYGPVVFPGEWLSWLTGAQTVAAVESLDSKPKWLKGIVQDPRAQWLDGDAGHAGVFGTALGIENWGRDLYLGFHGKSTILSDKVVRGFLDFEVPAPDASAHYIHGFDTPAVEGVSQAGAHFSKSTVGHLGYTGTSLWMDMERGYRVTLLTHRFQPNLDRDKLKKLRPAFHDWLHAEVFSKLKV